MKIGTKSVLFGAHCFLWHWLFVAVAWWKLYGFPWDPRLWFAFFVHDLGYLGKPNMDGEEGETHVVWGASLMYRWFDSGEHRLIKSICDKIWGRKYDGYWYSLCLYHSRFYAKKDGVRYSQLCVADKLSIVIQPSWMYLPFVRLTGEIQEYMALADSRTKAGEPKYASMNIATDSQERWYLDVQEYLRRWVKEHKDGKADTWTPNNKEAASKSGVWK